jgi:3D (Asp-Asp-Asp) domain-containing protein
VTIAKVYLGVLLCNEDDSYRSHKTSERNIGLGPDYYYPDYTLLSNYSLPADLPAGTYKLYPAYSASSGTPSIIPGINGNRYITVVVAQDGKVTLTAAAVKPDLSLVSLKAVGNLYRNRTGNFEAEITNSGMADYNARMSLRLGTQTVATDPVVIPAGATKTVGFSGNITLAVGTYSLSVRYDPDNVPGIEPSTQLGDVVSPIEVKATPTENPVLSLEGTPSFKNGSGTVPQNEPDLTVKIKNTGGVYQGNVYVDIYPKNSVDVQLGSFGSVYVSINKNETKSISYNNSLYSLTPGQQYDAYVYAEEYDYLYPKFTFTLAAPVYSSDATLKSLVVKDAQTQTPLALTPTFSSTITSYTAMAPHETTMISIIGEANHKRAQFTNIENQSLGGGNTFNMTVTAEDGATEKTYTVTVVRAEQPALTNLAVDGLTPPFDPDITEYAVTLPCGTDNFTATATPNAGSTVSYLVNNNPVTLPLPLHTPGMTSLVIRVTAQDGVTVHDYTIAITRPFDASIIRTYWNDVLAVNLNPNTNGGYVFTGFQWTKNGQPVANETGPYLYFPTPPPATDRYNVWLTTDNGQTLSTCSAIQITSAAVPPAGLLAYPNPARYAVTLENPQWETVAQTDLINLSGNLVRRYPSARIQTLDVSGLPVGLYILRAGAHTVKIVIE